MIAGLAQHARVVRLRGGDALSDDGWNRDDRVRETARWPRVRGWRLPACPATRADSWDAIVSILISLDAEHPTTSIKSCADAGRSPTPAPNSMDWMIFLATMIRRCSTWRSVVNDAGINKIRDAGSSSCVPRDVPPASARAGHHAVRQPGGRRVFSSPRRSSTAGRGRDTGPSAGAFR